MGLASVKQHITYERIIAPDVLQVLYNVADGVIYVLVLIQLCMDLLRLLLRVRGMGGLYFVRCGTHPGGRIPLVLLSGLLVIERVLADSEILRIVGQHALQGRETLHGPCPEQSRRVQHDIEALPPTASLYVLPSTLIHARILRRVAH